MDMIMSWIIIGLIIYFVVKKSINKKAETLATKTLQASIYSYFEKYHDLGFVGILRVNKKSDFALKALEFKEIHDINITTTPDKLIYTGATVGGVTTGGFHVQKGGTSASIGSGTGSWAVRYRFAKEFNGKPCGEHIVYMQLEDSLFAKAKQDAILQKLIVTDEERKKWKKSSYNKDELANVPCLLKVIGMDERTANHLKNWLAGKE